VIVVIGTPTLVRRGSDVSIGGRAGRIATAVAATGATVQLLAKVGDDQDGDALLLALAAAGIGHAAVLRDPANPTPVEVAEDDDGTYPLAEAEHLEDATAAGSHDRTGATRVATLDAADLELGLRYLVDFRVVVTADPLDDRHAATVSDAAEFAGAQVVAVVGPGERPPVRLDPATVLEAPGADPDGTFAGLVGAYASALDRGESAAAAWQGAALAGGWRPSTAEPSSAS
jgi:hypothetical protein